MRLEDFGWNAFFAEHFEPYTAEDVRVGRVSVEQKNWYRLYTERGELWAAVSGRMYHQALGRPDLPAVGDWVVIRVRAAEESATIHAVLPRRSQFSRKVAGAQTEEQILAANMDTVFLVTGLDQDFNPRRIERYHIMAGASGARPVIILNKADVCPDVEQKIREAESAAPEVPILVMSAAQGEGLEKLHPFMGSGQTVALLGSSGVGKSTLINRLMGAAVQRVQEVRPGDGRGKHTTTQRALMVLPSGALIIDTPGLRELQLWTGAEGWQETFADIEALAHRCYFRDCRHQDEPGCAIKEALADAALDPQRWQSYQKLQKERKYLALRQDQKASRIEKEKLKKLMRAIKKTNKHR